MDLSELRNKTTSPQRALLTAIWEHYTRNHEWPLGRTIRHLFGPDEVRQIVSALRGSIVFESRDAGRDRYQLTLLGVFLSNLGQGAEALLTMYLRHLREVFSANPEVDSVRGQDVATALQLNDKDSRLLCDLVMLSNLWGSTAGGGDQWQAGLPHDIEDVVRVKDLAKYLHQHAIKGYDPAMPVSEAERVAYGFAPRMPEPDLSKSAFVAMWFVESLNQAWEEGIKPGVEDAGCEPIRIDRIPHNDKICDRIVEEIHRCRFLIAEVTGHRPGVYFEAGLAMGLNKPVIWTCKAEELAKAHFDTRQYNHVTWETPADLRVKLRDRIQSTILPLLAARPD